MKTFLVVGILVAVFVVAIELVSMRNPVLHDQDLSTSIGPWRDGSFTEKQKANTEFWKAATSDKRDPVIVGPHNLRIYDTAPHNPSPPVLPPTDQEQLKSDGERMLKIYRSFKNGTA